MKLLLVAGLLMSSSVFAVPVKFDSTSGKVEWLGKKNVGDDKHTGTISLKSGNLDLANKKGEFVIDMTTIAVTDKDMSPDKKKKLAGHLSNKDFFEVPNNKEAKFVIKDIVKSPSEANKYAISGDMTVRGITNPETLNATITEAGKTTVVVSEFKLNRQKYNVKFNSKPEPTTEAEKQAENDKGIATKTKEKAEEVVAKVGDKWIEDEIVLNWTLKSI